MKLTASSTSSVNRTCFLKFSPRPLLTKRLRSSWYTGSFLVQ